jgi:glycosyltransferase involved in cell wall biosynthesis
MPGVRPAANPAPLKSRLSMSKLSGMHPSMLTIMTDPPLISVCMPVYNTEPYIAEAVESILAQTYHNFEFIVIDDGSTDRSLAILERYAARDPRIRLSSRPTAGYLVRLNEMLDEARGDLIARMDADDVAMPERFTRQIDFLDAHPEVVAVGSRILAIDFDGDPIVEFCTIEDHEEIDRAHLEVRGGYINHPAAMIRTGAIRTIGGYRAAYWPGEDVDLWLRLAEIGRLANLPERLLKYRQHLESIGYTRHAIQYERWQAAAIDAHHRRGLPLPSDWEPLTKNDRTTDTQAHVRKWAWWALGAGNLRTARKYALKSLRSSPLSLHNWKLVACSLRGY